MNLLEGTWVEVHRSWEDHEWCGHLCCTQTPDGRRWHAAQCEPTLRRRDPIFVPDTVSRYIV